MLKLCKIVKNDSHTYTKKIRKRELTGWEMRFLSLPDDIFNESLKLYLQRFTEKEKRIREIETEFVRDLVHNYKNILKSFKKDEERLMDIFIHISETNEEDLILFAYRLTLSHTAHMEGEEERIEARPLSMSQVVEIEKIKEKQIYVFESNEDKIKNLLADIEFISVKDVGDLLEKMKNTRVPNNRERHFFLFTGSPVNRKSITVVEKEKEKNIFTQSSFVSIMGYTVLDMIKEFYDAER